MSRVALIAGEPGHAFSAASAVVAKGVSGRSRDVAVGQGSLDSNNSGSRNVAVGRDALRNNTSGIQNTAIGFGAGALIDGSYNILIASDGQTGESNTLRIGRNHPEYAYIKGIAGSYASNEV